MRHIHPMTIAVWCGTTKPTVLNDYLGPFVRELNHLLVNPVSIINHTIIVRIRCFICDTPARAYMKGILNSIGFHIKRLFDSNKRETSFGILGIVGHNSYQGCQKCMAEGVYFRSLHKMAFPRIAETDREREMELRTDERFRNRFQSQHHKEYSILEELPIDMVRDFIISDALHLFDLGIVKR